MNIKTLFATYLRQQKLLKMPALVFDDPSLCRQVLTKSSAATPAVKQIVPQSGTPVTQNAQKLVRPQQQTQSPTTIPQSPVAVAGDSKNRLSTLRKIDRREIAPRVRKTAAPAAVVAAVPAVKLTFEQKREAMKKLFFGGCSQCHLSQTRKKIVFGSGNVDAPVLIIGEAPGEEEDNQGLPFVGDAGQLLTQMLAAVQIDRAKDAFITNVLKCHPISGESPDNADIATCLPILKKQIDIIQPKAILLLGRIAAHAVLGTSESISNMRSRVFKYNIIPCMAIYHPAALLKNASYKRPAWEDLKKFKELLDSLGVYGSLQ
ncbi:MAG TPA: uracil-DNA glycosylase [Chitinispirillaceae bacterium]|nr:uracil-DNA glycosylase [Chitinispirillaceae bacterium]